MVGTSSTNAEGAGSIPGRGAKILHASQPKNQNIKQKLYCNTFSEDFKNGPCQKNLKKEKKKIEPISLCCLILKPFHIHLILSYV